MLTPINAIRAKCLDCCCGHIAEIRNCTVKNCALYPYRMGHRPKSPSDTTGDTFTENKPESPGILTTE